MTTPPDQNPLMRASDEDRAATVHALQEAVVRGLLTPDEGSERMAAAWAAVHVRDLGPLTADLPPAQPVRTAPGWGVLATMATEQLRTSVRGVRSGRLSPARVAAAFAVVLLLVVLVGSLVGELLFDGGHGHGGFDDD
jgi:Domain of unknown function (DUF1707)